MKRIIVCCDGTWNAPEINNPEKNRPTNVLHLTRAVMPLDGPVVQVVEYIPGVGTHKFLDRWVGGATGYGISLNITSAYQFIAHNFVPGDQLYLFGFSRGAYTIRSLAGFIDYVKMIRKTELYKLPEAYAMYRRRYSVLSLTEWLRASQNREIPEIPIYFLGCFDTVGSLGAPTPHLRQLTRNWVSFHDTSLPKNVTYAYQALAIHEIREDFIPDLWTSIGKGQIVEQCWFPGAHSDVGGGLHGTHLSAIPLKWMADKASTAGLRVDFGYVSGLAVNPLEPISRSRTGLFRATPRRTRSIGHFGVNETRHSSCDARIAAWPDETVRYPSKQYGADGEWFTEADLYASRLPSAP